MVRPLYRGRQFLHALHPRIDADDRTLVRKLLDGQALQLFDAMEKRDQRHAIEVAHRLSAAGVVDADLLSAALLHDCGKGSVPVVLRVLKVLSPGLVRASGSGSSKGWRGAAYRLSHHATIGAAQVREAGLSGTVERLISGAIRPEEEWKLLLLRSADDAS